MVPLDPVEDHYLNNGNDLTVYTCVTTDHIVDFQFIHFRVFQLYVSKSRKEQLEKRNGETFSFKSMCKDGREMR